VSFLDKVKQAAEKAAEGAKKGTAQVKEKIELGQLRKKADEDAKQLGYLIVRERSDGTPAGEESDRLVQEILSLEAQIREAGEEQAASADTGAAAEADAAVPTTDAGPGPAPAPPAPAPPAPVPTSSSEPAAGDFKLE